MLTAVLIGFYLIGVVIMTLDNIQGKIAGYGITTPWYKVIFWPIYLIKFLITGE